MNNYKPHKVRKKTKLQPIKIIIQHNFGIKSLSNMTMPENKEKLYFR